MSLTQVGSWATNETKSEKTRRQLIEAAQELFAEKGYAATSVKEIASRAGVNVSLISYYFKGKEGLYLACLDEFGKSVRVVMERVLQPASTRQELRLRVRLFMDEMIDNHLENSHICRILHRDIETDNPVTLEVFRTRFFPIFECLVSFFKAARRKGVVRKETDPMALATALMGILNHITRMDHLAQRFFDRSIRETAYRRQLLDQVEALFCEGILSE